jgi:hypothetical protein
LENQIEDNKNGYKNGYENGSNDKKEIKILEGFAVSRDRQVNSFNAKGGKYVKI